MVGVDHDGGVDGVRGEEGVVDFAEVCGDVGEAGGFFFLFEVADHFGLDVDGDDFSPGALGGEAEGVVAGAGSDIGNDGIGF